MKPSGMPCGSPTQFTESDPPRTPNPCRYSSLILFLEMLASSVTLGYAALLMRRTTNRRTPGLPPVRSGQRTASGPRCRCATAANLHVLL